MPFKRRTPTAEEIERLEAQSYAALEATLGAGTQTEASFRAGFSSLNTVEPPARPSAAAKTSPPSPRTDAEVAADVASLAFDQGEIEKAARTVDAAAERIYRASVETVAAPDEVEVRVERIFNDTSM